MKNSTKKKYKVVWAQSALNDFQAIIEFISLEHPLNAKKVYEKIKLWAKGLSANPLRGRVVQEEVIQTSKMEMRELVMAPWRLIYQVKKSRVEVLCLLDSRRDTKDFLLKRFLLP